MTDVDRDPEIVEIFVAESLEALDRLESLLIDAEGGSPQPDMLDVLSGISIRSRGPRAT